MCRRKCQEKYARVQLSDFIQSSDQLLMTVGIHDLGIRPYYILQAWRQQRDSWLSFTFLVLSVAAASQQLTHIVKAKSQIREWTSTPDAT